jgi:hypothetical protein
MQSLLCAGAIAAETSVRDELGLCQLPTVHGDRYWNWRVLRSQHYQPPSGPHRRAVRLETTPANSQSLCVCRMSYIVVKDRSKSDAAKPPPPEPEVVHLSEEERGH